MPVRRVTTAASSAAFESRTPSVAAVSRVVSSGSISRFSRATEYL